MMQNQNLVIADFQTGYETDVPPFKVSNDAFPVLNNAYVWRKRVKKKRGTKLLGRLRRDLTSQSGAAYTSIVGTNTINIISSLGLNGTNASIIPATLVLVFGAPIGQTLTDAAGTGTLAIVPAGTITAASINYATGVISITAGAAVGPVTTAFTLSYFPNLPVMGLEDFQLPRAATSNRLNFPTLVASDTRYSYQFNQVTNTFYDVTFYKGSHTPFTWNGGDFDQFWSVNYQGAMFQTNSQPGFYFGVIDPMVGITVAANAIATFTSDTGLVAGDKIWFNQVVGMVEINELVGTVVSVDITGTIVTTDIDSTTFTPYTSGGIAQFLTSGDGNGIRWYDGDPVADVTKGWVNFAPPIDSSATPQYLVGAKILVTFKNRLLAFGVWLQSSTGSARYFPNRMIASWTGTVYYNSFVPTDQTFDVSSWYTNVAVKGVDLTAAIDEEICVVGANEDVLIVKFESYDQKLIFTFDDSLPFIYQSINNELGGLSTFSGVSLDAGVLSFGSYGFSMTTQNSAQRIDLRIPDEVFQVALDDNGDQRVCATRDFRNEFIYFTFSSVNKPWKFPDKTLLFNYRDNTWATLDECYTHYGQFRRTDNVTWATIGSIYPTWASWVQAWNSGGDSARFPTVIGGNQQGFVLEKIETTREDTCRYIKGVSTYTITCPDHCLDDGDFIEIFGCLGVTNINNEIWKVQVEDSQTNTFTLIPTQEQITNPPTGTYIGGGTFRRLANFFIQTKQFPIYWDKNRKTRFGTQRFCLDNTEDGEVTAMTFGSQNPNTNMSNPLVSASLVYSQVLLTRAEPQQPQQISQDQIWHRISNSFIGDTIQIGLTLSDDQMYDNNINSAEVTLHAFVVTAYPGPLLC